MFLETGHFSLKVPMFVQPEVRQSPSPSNSEGSDVKPAVFEQAESVKVTETVEVLDPQMNVDLTNDDIDEMLGILAQHTLPSTSMMVTPDIDDDLKEILGMDIADFVV